MNKQNKIDGYKNMPADKLVEEICKLVLKSERPMPAVFTGDGKDRTQTFLVDFEDIDAKDEYQMASASWHWVGQYMEQGNNFTHGQLMTIVRCGEDLMIASYIIQKLERNEILDKVAFELIDSNKNSWPAEMDIPQIFSTKSAKDWFNFCKNYGAEVAKGKYI